MDLWRLGLHVTVLLVACWGSGLLENAERSERPVPNSSSRSPVRQGWHGSSGSARNVLVILGHSASAGTYNALSEVAVKYGVRISKILTGVKMVVIQTDRRNNDDLLLALHEVKGVSAVSRDIAVTQLGDAHGKQECRFTGEIDIPDIMEKGESALRAEVDVLNISLGVARSGESNREILEKKREWRTQLLPLVRYAKQRDRLVILAAGNAYAEDDNVTLTAGTPRSDLLMWNDYTLVVGAIGKDNRPSSFSDKGRVVDVYSSGEGVELPKVESHYQIIRDLVWSAVGWENGLVLPHPAEKGAVFFGERILAEKMTCDGTSFAAAQVSVIAAITRLTQSETALSAPALKRVLLEGAGMTGGVRVLRTQGLKAEIAKRGENGGRRIRPVIGIVEAAPTENPSVWYDPNPPDGPTKSDPAK